ncbi:UDP-N-acetylmuramate--L-alanine ligase [Ruminococcaceae bacterium OttesenSCG-928-N02]|nr:UDP-N-acetylmuramate--L-alanine ligase [Ruminococcaceae bacterium OttesenSCG-928-N02]
MEKSDLLQGKKHLHFIGIGGSGMYPLVQILAAQGYKITGSDVLEGDIINYERAMGIDVHIGHAAQNVHGADLVVYTAALLPGNPEKEEAQRLGIPCVERSIMLGYVAGLYPQSICVSGTHGKTTTTSMVTQILVSAGKDPAAVIGGKLPLIGGYGRSGKGENIVVEACEFSNTFLHLRPYVSIILNIDADHLDFFGDMAGLKAAFKEFAALTTGPIIANGEDENTMQVLAGMDAQLITYGIGKGFTYGAENVHEARPSFYSFTATLDGVPIGDFTLSVPGLHNVSNALAAIAACHTTGCTAAEIAQGLAGFKGAGRRFELMGEVNGITIVDDYAHHPAELAATLKAAKNMGYKKVWAVHQPFTYSRTKTLLKDFAEALRIADEVVMTEIMGSRETNEKFNIYTKDLAALIPGSVWFNTFEEVVAYTMAHASAGDLVITLGCGDIYKAAKMMVGEK